MNDVLAVMQDDWVMMALPFLLWGTVYRGHLGLPKPHPTLRVSRLLDQYASHAVDRFVDLIPSFLGFHSCLSPTRLP